MVILAAGTYRSASTLQFNILRVILEQSGEVYSCYVDDYDPQNETPVHLVKIHRPSLEMAGRADKIFTSIRSKEGILGSIRRRKKFDPTLRIEEIESYMTWFNFWATRADFIQTYEMTKDIKKLVRTYLGELGLGERRLSKILSQLQEEMKVPEEGRDEKTLLHHGHITSD